MEQASKIKREESNEKSRRISSGDDHYQATLSNQKRRRAHGDHEMRDQSPVLSSEKSRQQHHQSPVSDDQDGDQLLDQQQHHSFEGDSNRPKRNPYCSRCRNHGKNAQVKGHKRHCEYRDCQCEGCKLVEARQIVSALQIKRRRYQKQDEECGRHIEVSPPVLTRSLSNDPASIIAKTLTGSTDRRHSANVSPSSTSSALTAILSTNSLMNQHAGHQQHQQLYSQQLHQSPLGSGLQGATMAPSTAASAINQVSGIYSGCSGNPDRDQQYQRNLEDSQHYQNHNRHSLDSLKFSSNSGATMTPSSCSQSLATTNQQLSNAFHMFQFPGSLMSSGDPSAASSIDGSKGKLTAGSDNMRLPASHAQAVGHQLRSVEQIYQAFGGPLAIYAWLKAEQFDIERVRNQIENSRSAYSEMLLQLDSKSVSNELNIICNSNQCLKGDLMRTVANSSDASVAIAGTTGASGGGGGGGRSSRSHSASSTSGSLSGKVSENESRQSDSCEDNCAISVGEPGRPIGERSKGDDQWTRHQEQPVGGGGGNGGASVAGQLPGFAQAGAAVSAGYPSMEAQHFGLDRHNLAALAIATTSANNNSLPVMSNATISLGHHNALATSANDVLWPSALKLQGITGAGPLIHPHLLPHFMPHHHSLLTHHQQAQQHQHYQLSTMGLINANSPMGSSLSSAAAAGAASAVNGRL